MTLADAQDGLGLRSSDTERDDDGTIPTPIPIPIPFLPMANGPRMAWLLVGRSR